MKLRFVFSVVIIILLNVGVANSQITPSTQKVLLTGSDKEILDKHISKYSAFIMNRKELIDYLYTNEGGQFQLRINEEMDWLLDLEFNDMRGAGFKQIYKTDEGEFEYNEPFVVNTLKGKTSDGRIARFTIDDNNFFGIILDAQDHYVIRSVDDYIKNGSNILIAYKYSDIIFNDDNSNYINDAIVIPDDIEDIIKNGSKKSGDVFLGANLPGSCRYYLKIATEADYEYYLAKGIGNTTGNKINATNNSIMTVLNSAEGIYESTFDLKFIVSAQFVITSASQNYTSNNDTNLLTKFMNYWNNNRKNIERNIAHLFTGKTFSNGTLGLSILDCIDETYNSYYGSCGYGFSSIDNYMNIIFAHEIGHSLGANHITPNNISACQCNTLNNGSIMCATVWIPANFWFCQQSINEITSSLNSKMNVLGYNTLPVYYSPTSTTIHSPVINVKNTEVKSGATLILDAKTCGGSVIINPNAIIESGATFIIK